MKLAPLLTRLPHGMPLVVRVYIKLFVVMLDGKNSRGSTVTKKEQMEYFFQRIENILPQGTTFVLAWQVEGEMGGQLISNVTPEVLEQYGKMLIKASEEANAATPDDPWFDRQIAGTC